MQTPFDVIVIIRLNSDDLHSAINNYIINEESSQGDNISRDNVSCDEI